MLYVGIVFPVQKIMPVHWTRSKFFSLDIGSFDCLALQCTLNTYEHACKPVHTCTHTHTFIYHSMCLWLKVATQRIPCLKPMQKSQASRFSSCRPAEHCDMVFNLMGNPRRVYNLKLFFTWDVLLCLQEQGFQRSIDSEEISPCYIMPWRRMWMAFHSFIFFNVSAKIIYPSFLIWLSHNP